MSARSVTGPVWHKLRPSERRHQRVRTEFWGYASDEALSNEALIAEQCRGIRPAPGDPACPDHRIKRALFEVLKAAVNRPGFPHMVVVEALGCRLRLRGAGRLPRVGPSIPGVSDSPLHDGGAPSAPRPSKS